MAAVGVVVLLLRMAHILSSGPLEDVSLELVYLRLGDLRWPSLLVLSAVFLEVAEFVYLRVTGWTGARMLSAWGEAMNGLQALLLLVATLWLFLRLREYTAPGQKRHVDATLSDLAERRGPRAPAPDVAQDEESSEE